MADEHQIPWTPTPEEFDDTWEGQDVENIPDILSTMFAQQAQHMAGYAVINEDALPFHLHGDLENRKVQAAIREFAGYTIEELLGEAISGHLKNKPWKQSDRPVDRDAFLEEMADAWHFFIELHIIAGVTPVEVFKQYFKKTLENNERRASGY
jgi:hypothetical protein